MRRLLLAALASALCIAGPAAPVLAAPGTGQPVPSVDEGDRPNPASDRLAPTVAPNRSTANVGPVRDGKRSVGLGKVRVDVPADWPVVDLDRTPRACVRLDLRAVYVGTPAADQDCPARAIGRADTIVISPTPERLKGAIERSRRAAGGRVDVDESREGMRHVVLPESGVTVSATWGQEGDSRVESVLAAVSAGAEAAVEGAAPSAEPQPSPKAGSVPEPQPGSTTPLSTGTTSPPTPTHPPAGVEAKTATEVPAVAPESSLLVSPSASENPPAARSAIPSAYVAAPAAVSPSGRHLLGAAFDACQAPSVATMQAWRASPYAAVGIYTSGSMRACAQPQLTASWIQQVQAQGWGFIPIHVGLQAPCTESPKVGRYSYDPGTARGQGAGEAASASTALRALGLPGGSTAYLDIEGYSMTDPACTTATLAFVSGWTDEMHRQGFGAGVYGGLGSLMRDMSSALASGNTSFVAPDHVWFARWNHLQTVQDVNTPTYLPDRFWTNRQRLHQYYGDHNETWGGVTINIDSNWVDAVLPGNSTQVDYGARTMGPGSAGFVFTGSMAYWRAAPGTGERGRAFWTAPSSTSTEYNGATWAPSLAPGSYRVEANVPDSSMATTARYTITGANGATTTVLDQAGGAGWRSLGTVAVTSTTPALIHVGDNSGGPTDRRIWVDAMRFTPLGIPPAPASVAAVPGAARATVVWTPVVVEITPITAYVVTVSPGGSRVVVPASDTEVVIDGLTNGTAHTFTVAAVTAEGTGSGRASAPVVPSASLQPARVQRLDLDSDGRPDVVARGPDARLWLYSGNGASGWFGSKVIGHRWEDVNTIMATGDFDGDRRPDLLGRVGNGDLYLYSGDGRGGWVGARVVGTRWEGFDELWSPGDFDGDGAADVMGRMPNGLLYLYSGNGVGGWRSSGIIGTGWSGFTSLFSPGDFDGDGRADVLARAANGELWLYRGNGAGGWLGWSVVGYGWQGLDPLFGPGDVNGDGTNDVIARSATGSLLLYAGDGRGSWRGSAAIGWGWGPFTAFAR